MLAILCCVNSCIYNTRNEETYRKKEDVRGRIQRILLDGNLLQGVDYFVFIC